jgi:hypothetical protein
MLRRADFSSNISTRLAKLAEEVLRKAEIEETNQSLARQQLRFRAAADALALALAAFDEVLAIGLTGSVAKPLWKEVPRFSQYRRAGIEVWHECKDIDLAVWLDSRGRLNEMRRAKDKTLLNMGESGGGAATHQADIFLFEPGSDRYLGRLCWFNACPKGKPECQVPGCGNVPFNKIHKDFRPDANLLAAARQNMLYERGKAF